MNYEHLSLGERKKLLAELTEKFAHQKFEVLDRKYNFSDETREFMTDLYKHDLSEAYANRLFKINVLELNGSKMRLDYLTQID